MTPGTALHRRYSLAIRGLLLAVMALAQVGSWTGVAPAWAQAAKAQIVVDSETASPHFPDTVDFALRAHGFEAYRVELNYRLVGDAVTAEMAAPVDTATANINTQVSLDLGTHYIPPGAQVVYYWALTGDAQNEVYTPERTFTMPDPRHTWRSITDAGKRVTVHWYSGSQNFGNNLSTRATEALNRLQTDIGAGLVRPADIYIYDSQDSLLAALPKNLPEWVGGKAFPEMGLVLAAIADDKYANDETNRIVPHELSHLVLYQASVNPYNSPPAWMDEGLAVRNQEYQDPAEEQALKDAAESGKLVPLKSLTGSFGADYDAALLSYGESRSVMDFVLSDKRYGPAKLARTVAAFKDGVTYDDALKAGLGVTTDELDLEWRASLPYKVSSVTPTGSESGQDAAPARADGPGTILGVSWNTAATIAVASLCGLVFVVGGLLTLFALLRRRTV